MGVNLDSRAHAKFAINDQIVHSRVKYSKNYDKHIKKLQNLLPDSQHDFTVEGIVAELRKYLGRFISNLRLFSVSFCRESDKLGENPL